MVELADTQVLGTCAARLGGSNPSIGTSRFESRLGAKPRFAGRVLPEAHARLTRKLAQCYDRVMSQFLLGGLAAIFLLVSLAQPLQASSTGAYQDYLYQFDLYRAKYTDFKVAKNEYEKFKTLTSATDALEKTRTMLSQRDQLLRAYLFLLNEKLNEDKGLGTSDKQLYQTLIRNEVGFLQTHSQLVPSVGSLSDAVTVSQQLESHYLVLQASIRQTIVALHLGQLALLASQYDTLVSQAKNLITANSSFLPAQKQATVDRWLLQISNKRSLFGQKYDSLMRADAQLKGPSIDELDRSLAEMQKNISEARQYLVEGTAFINELLNSLKTAP